MFTRFNPPPQINSNQSTEAIEQRFSLQHLRQIYQQLLTASQAISSENEDLVVEILYNIAEMVVYGDNKSELLFDFFCEKNMLSLFLDIMWTGRNGYNSTTPSSYTYANQSNNNQIHSMICPNKIHIQILQTLSILINSVKNDTSLYYLLSNNYINEIIVFPHDFDDDESLRDQFVSFMKSLSLRLNSQTVQFFFVEETGAFPLLSRAIDILRFSEPMVRIACQTTILNILTVSDPRSRSYALQDDLICKFLGEVVKILNSYYFSMVKISLEYLSLIQNETSRIRPSDIQAFTRLENSLDDITAAFEDWIYFMQDIVGLKIFKIRYMTISHIMSDFVYPTLLLAFMKLHECQSMESKEIFSLRASPWPSPTQQTTQTPDNDHSYLPDHYNNNYQNSSFSYGQAEALQINRTLLLDSHMENRTETTIPIDRYAVKEAHGILRNSGANSHHHNASESSDNGQRVEDDEKDICDRFTNIYLSDDEVYLRCSVSIYFLSQVSIPIYIHRSISNSSGLVILS